ncbi:hypothetical protein [Novosphingobium sp. 9U]|uniref:hypothetical protein n=1 Tax=Novosphingobium sp. 9U TaxID=2653158 RepID=UPI0012F1216C|nr:hypothetical protein [Novosphingobium sp. 9U]VWX48339.1 hypothetical protein NOVOSPHI9U_150019 [Novosphingobium sp. 9U]
MHPIETKAAKLLTPTLCRSRLRSRFTIADDLSVRQHRAVSITPAILRQLPLPEISAVTFYKRDEITTDLICCDVQVAGQVWSFHEEVTGWLDLMSHLSALPSFRADWYEAVVSEPFSTSETVAYQRQ